MQQNKNLSVLTYVEVFWWSEATQIRTIALWSIFGGDLIECDGFCAVFVVEYNQNFFIIKINRIHESAVQSANVRRTPGWLRKGATTGRPSAVRGSEMYMALTTNR